MTRAQDVQVLARRQGSSVHAFDLTVDHKPTLPAEHARIVAAGGRVQQLVVRVSCVRATSLADCLVNLRLRIVACDVAWAPVCVLKEVDVYIVCQLQCALLLISRQGMLRAACASGVCWQSHAVNMVTQHVTQTLTSCDHFDNDLAQDEDGEPVGPARVWLRDAWLPGLAMSRSIGDQARRPCYPFSFLLYALAEPPTNPRQRLCRVQWVPIAGLLQS